MSNLSANFSPPSTSRVQSSHPPLPIAEVGLANKRAQIHGTLTGGAAGVIAAVGARTVLKLSKNATLLGGLLTGVSAGYIATRYRLSQNLADLERSVVLRGQGRAHGSGTGPGRLHGDSGPGAIPPELVAELRAVGEKNFEAGVGGLHELEDRYATTRGDH